MVLKIMLDGIINLPFHDIGEIAFPNNLPVVLFRSDNQRQRTSLTKGNKVLGSSCQFRSKTNKSCLCANQATIQHRSSHRSENSVRREVDNGVDNMNNEEASS